jgi:hypothetical protein
LRAGKAAYDRRQGRCGKSPERTRTCRQSSFSLIQLLSTLIIVLAEGQLHAPIHFPVYAARWLYTGLQHINSATRRTACSDDKTSAHTALHVWDKLPAERKV